MRVYGALQVLVNELRDPLLKDIGYDPIQNIAVALAHQTGSSSAQAKQAIQQATTAVNRSSSGRHQYTVHKAQGEQAVRNVQLDDNEFDVQHTARSMAAESKLHNNSSDHCSSSIDNSNSIDGSNDAKHSEQQQSVDYNAAVDSTSDSHTLKKSSSATAIQKRWRWHKQTKQDKQQQQQRQQQQQESSNAVGHTKQPVGSTLR